MSTIPEFFSHLTSNLCNLVRGQAHGDEERRTNNLMNLLLCLGALKRNRTKTRDRRGRMVVGFTTTYAISA